MGTQANCINTPNVKWSWSIRLLRQLLRWLPHIMPINWLQGALLTQKILIIQILEQMMKWMINRIGSLSMKQIVAFTMNPTWQLFFCLIWRPHHFQGQEFSLCLSLSLYLSLSVCLSLSVSLCLSLSHSVSLCLTLSLSTLMKKRILFDLHVIWFIPHTKFFSTKTTGLA